MEFLLSIILLLGFQARYGSARVAPVSSPTASAPGDGVCDTAITVHAPEATPMYWYQDSLTYEPYVRTCRLECPDKARNCTSPSSYGDIYPNPTPFSIVEDLGAPATTTLNVPNPTHYSALTVDNNPQFSTYEVTTTFALPQQTGKDGTPFSDTIAFPTPIMYYENIVLESGSPGKVKGSCDRTRVTSRLPRNYLDLYTGKAQRDWAGVKTIDGKVPQGVLDLLAGKRGPQYVAGTFQGTPTIIAVVVGDPTDVPAPCEITPIITKHPSEPNKGTQESTQYGEDGGLPTLGAPMPEKSVSPPDPTDLPDPGDSFGGGEESSTTSFKRPSLAKPETTRRGEDGDELPTPVGPTPQVSSGKMNAVVTPSPDVPNVGSVILSILNSNPPTPRGGGANSQPQVTGPAQRPTPVIKFKGSTITANTQSNFIVGGQTLAPGSAITVDNTPISLAPEPTAVFIGGSSFAVNNVPAPTAAPSITFGGSVITASNSQFVIEGQTLTPGGAITVSGTAVSLGDSGSTLVVGSSTFAVGGTMAPVFSVGDTEYTASASTFVVQGQTLTPGGSVTIGGTVYSLQPGGTAVVIGGTSTVSLSSVAVATTTADDAIATAAGTQNSGLRIKSGLGLLASLLVMALSVIS